MKRAVLLFTTCLAGSALALGACNSDEEPSGSGGTTTTDGGTGGENVGGSGGQPPPSECQLLGFDETAFVDADSNSALYAVASDLVISTTDGDYGIKERWTGCDVHLFIQDVPRQNTSYAWPTPLWDRDVDTLLLNAPKNTRFFFNSSSADQVVIDGALAGLQAKVEEALTGMTLEDADHWRGRIHYVNVPTSALPGWLNAQMVFPRWGVGIDRHQRLRFIGSYADPTRFSNDAGWFAPNLSMAANEARFYNYEYDRDAALAATNSTVVTVFPGGEGSTGAATDVTFPDAATMAGFDTMLLDMTMGCIGPGEFGDCPAWDYMAYVYLCPDAQQPDVCDVEVGRWITTYHREGRWVHDASALLPLFKAGGTFRLKFDSPNAYDVGFDIHLSNADKAARPDEVTYLYDAFGVSFNATYNDGFSPMDLLIPADATKVELATIISGHGQNDPGNCAEFCVTTHHFFVNGTENVVELSDAGSQWGCMDQVDSGTIPNQYGTWWFGRSGWCPGRHVPVEMIDITDQVTPGEMATFDYEGYRNGQPYAGSATIRLRSWLVISR